MPSWLPRKKYKIILGATALFLVMVPLAAFGGAIRSNLEYPWSARVLLLCGEALQESGESDRALRVYLKLVKQYPNPGDPWSEKAMLHLGELYSERGSLKEAFGWYEKIYLNKSHSEVFFYGVYKLAWYNYNKQKYSEGLALLNEVLEHKEKTASNSLKDEILRDYALFYIRIGSAESLIEYFDSIELPGSKRIVPFERLAQIYLEFGKYGDSTTLFKELIALNPDSFVVVGYQLNVVNNTKILGDSQKTALSMNLLALLYLNVIAVDEKDRKKVEIMGDNINKLLWESALWYDKAAEYEAAAILYKAYLSFLFFSEHHREAMFNLAEIYFKARAWDQALEAYNKILPFGAYDIFYPQAVMRTEVLKKRLK